MFKKMNLPNKLTMLRIVLVPFFVIAMALPSEWVWPLWTAFGIFIVAAITDCLDGQISRRKNLVTKFGKIMDPLADKLLISVAFVMLSGKVIDDINVIPAWITAIIIFRDFFVNGLRMFGADKGAELSAGLSGKLKTVFQLIGLSLAIFGLAFNSTYATFGIFIEKSSGMGVVELLVNVGMTVSIAAAVLATLWSFVDYLIRFKENINVEE